MTNTRRVIIKCSNKDVTNSCTYGKCEQCVHCVAQPVGKSYYTNQYGVTGFKYVSIGKPIIFSEVSEKIYNGYYTVV